MSKNDFIKLITATVAVLSLATAPALAQDPLSEAYGGEDGNNSNEVAGDDDSGVLGDTAGGGSDPGTVLDDPASLGNPSDPSETAVASAGDSAGDSGGTPAAEPEPAAARPVDSLPFTGADMVLVTAMGIALFLLGLGLSLLTHRRSGLRT